MKQSDPNMEQQRESLVRGVIFGGDAASEKMNS